MSLRGSIRVHCRVRPPLDETSLARAFMPNDERGALCLDASPPLATRVEPPRPVRAAGSNTRPARPSPHPSLCSRVISHLCQGEEELRGVSVRASPKQAPWQDKARHSFRFDQVHAEHASKPSLKGFL